MKKINDLQKSIAIDLLSEIHLYLHSRQDIITNSAQMPNYPTTVPVIFDTKDHCVCCSMLHEVHIIFVWCQLVWVIQGNKKRNNVMQNFNAKICVT